MRFMLIGAGGIGAYYGARLQQAGHEVVLVARGKHLLTMQQSGLHVSHPTFHFQQPVIACSQQDILANPEAYSIDLIIVTLKASQTQAWLEQAQFWLQSINTPLLSLQNGIDNEPLIAACIGTKRTIGGLAVRIGGHIICPGVIEATGIAQIIMGAWPQNKESEQQYLLNNYAACFNEAGIPTRVTDNIQRELWLKLLINNGVNPLSALTGLDTRSLTTHPVYRKTVYQLMEETARAAQADGLQLNKADVDDMFQLIAQFDAIKTSMLVDKEKGRPLETDAISGAVIRRCNQLGIDAPLTALIESLLNVE